MSGRPVKIRVSYVADAQYMARIARAVELDKERPSAWRRKALGHLEELTSMFMAARAPDNETKPAPESSGPGND